MHSLNNVQYPPKNLETGCVRGSVPTLKSPKIERNRPKSAKLVSYRAQNVRIGPPPTVNKSKKMFQIFSLPYISDHGFMRQSEPVDGQFGDDFPEQKQDSEKLMT